MPATDPVALAEWNKRCPGAPPPAGLWRSSGQSWAFRKVAGRFKWPSRKGAEPQLSGDRARMWGSGKEGGGP